MKSLLFFLFAVISLCSSCAPRRIHSDDPDIAALQIKIEEKKLLSINIIDRNGLSETLTAKDRLSTYENADFFAPQTYQKVLRVYSKDNEGKNLSIITSYYPTGQIKQYLEAVNGSAYGTYLEWHQNGKKKLHMTVLGGSADLDDKSQSNWSFDGKSSCWSESGSPLAEVYYEKGVLSGTSLYFHPNGVLAEEIPYVDNEIHGERKLFDEQGSLIEISRYISGSKDGSAQGWWGPQHIAWEEMWDKGLLSTGRYFDLSGTLICSIVEGTGTRCVFDDNGPIEMHEYVKGKQEGLVRIFGENQYITQTLHVKNGLKHGLETYYYPVDSKPRLTIEWYEGQIHGTVKTWYEDGTQESQREMSHNAKQGLLSAWYHDGQLMLLEEYEKNKLTRGDYLKQGEAKPVSKVVNGNGVATFYDPDGTFVRRVQYENGKPIEESA